MALDDSKNTIENGIAMAVIHFDPETLEETGREKYDMQNVGLSKWQVESLAHALLPEIQEYYADPENVWEFETWKTEKDCKVGKQKISAY